MAELNGKQIEQISAALLVAFNTEELRQLAVIELGVDLERIVREGGTLSQRVLDLIEWAQRQNRLAELLCGAYNRNGNNAELTTLIEQAVHWPECLEAGMVVQDGRASCFAQRVHELAYLDGLLAAYDAWARLYTPLPGDVEVAVSGRRAPRLLAPDSFLPQEFDLVASHEFAAQPETRREAVDDLCEAVATHKRLVVLGEPGAGKTTTLQMLCREYAQAAKQDKRAPLPVLVALGGYTGAEPPLEYVMRSAGSLDSHLLAYLKAGRAVLLLDALNEMPQHDYRERVKRIKSLIDRYRDTPVLVTCRALNYIEELKLRKLQIRPLDERRQKEYLRRYLGDEDGDALFWRLAGGAEVAKLWAAWEKKGGAWEDFWRAEEMPKAVYRTTSVVQDKLWRDLRGGKLASLLALSVNPYMLAMLIKVYVEGAGVLPQNRAQLFDAFATVLLARERKRADSRDWPGDAPLRAALGQLAYAMQQVGERGTAVDLAWAASKLIVPGLSADAALYWARSATLLESQGDQLRFVHQLVQEYFAAAAMLRRFEQGDDLAHYWPNGWLEPSGWEETAVLLAGMLPDMTPFVEKLTPVNSVLAARCIAESGGHKPAAVTIERVRQRLVGLATSVTAPLMERVAAGKALNYVGDPRPGVGLRADGLPDIVWCDVPAGEFIMGSSRQADSQTYDDEMPQHRLFLAAFSIARYPITNAQFQTFIDDGGYTEKCRKCWTEAGWAWRSKESVTGPVRRGGDFDLPSHPAAGVSWHEAVAFCNWLAARLGDPVRLPTEAEWEKAARGTDGREYPWGEDADPNRANYDKSKIGGTSPVGCFPNGKSPYGCLDMAGNVWEWTSTLYKPYPYRMNGGREDPNAGGSRTWRGGSYLSNQREVRAGSRFGNDPRNWHGHLGFRLARTLS